MKNNKEKIKKIKKRRNQSIFARISARRNNTQQLI
jgi:hypothetical protein